MKQCCEDIEISTYTTQVIFKSVGKAAFRLLCKACDIKASPHVLRHTAATWLVMDGVPLAEVARFLGGYDITIRL